MHIEKDNFLIFIYDKTVVMKKFNRKLIKGTNWALAGLMSFLGFSSCLPMNEYGTPYADFIISGKVTDMEGNALTRIKVAAVSADHCQVATPSFTPTYPVITEELNENFVTNDKGEFVYPYKGFPTDTVKIKLKFDDVANNTFASDSTTVVFLDSELKGGKGWNEGKTEKKVNIKLKRKESE